MTVEDFDRKLLVFRNYTEKTVRRQVDGVDADGVGDDGNGNGDDI